MPVTPGPSCEGSDMKPFTLQRRELRQYQNLRLSRPRPTAWVPASAGMTSIGCRDDEQVWRQQRIGRGAAEELAVDVAVFRLLDSWLYVIPGSGAVLIVACLCRRIAGMRDDRVSHEHKALTLAPLSEIGALPMPEGYRRSVRKAAAMGEGR